MASRCRMLLLRHQLNPQNQSADYTDYSELIRVRSSV
jgi:hypothetical protein